MKKLLIITLSILAISGCATKQYPQAAKLSNEESSAMDCNALKIEIAKTLSIQQDIEKTGEFDGRTVLGVLGDLGVGNGIAKTEARKKAQNRLNQLNTIKSVKCQK
ncbi:lipoprotein [Edwardsiella tarda]